MLASGRNVNVLVLDTEVYSNTGGQSSKATPLGGGGEVRGRRQADAARRTWAMMAMSYGNVYVAQIAMGANDRQTVRAFLEAESYRRSVAHHCLQPLHRPRHQHGQGHGPAEAGDRDAATGRCIRFDPRLKAGGQEPLPPGLQGAEDSVAGLCLQREPLPHAGAVESGTCRAVAQECAGVPWTSAGSAMRKWRSGVPQGRPRRHPITCVDIQCRIFSAAYSVTVDRPSRTDHGE